MYLIKPRFEILDFNCSPELIERAGRTCYKSECKGEPEKFVEMICKRQHESILEFSFICVKFIIDRGIANELVRHRICSFAQESTRYVNYKKKGITFIIPDFIDLGEGQYLGKRFYDCGVDFTLNGKEVDVRFESKEYYWLRSIFESTEYYKELIAIRQTPEQARSVLPMSLATELIVAANAREWLHIFKLRCDKTAHPQMQEIMIPLLKEFQERCPVIFNQVKIKD